MANEEKAATTTLESTPDTVEETVSEGTRLSLQKLNGYNGYEAERKNRSSSEKPVYTRSWREGILSQVARVSGGR
jgi:hypothetical protein